MCYFENCYKLKDFSYCRNLNSSFTKDPLHSTRFIALANYTSQEKANKGIYAFNIQPMDFIQNVDLQKPEIATENPFTELFNEVSVHVVF